MLLHYAIAFFIPIAAVFASQGEPCCYPSQLSGEMSYHGKKMNSFYIDYGRNRIVEDWAGRIGTDFVVYDLSAKKRYRMKSNGDCRAFPLTSLGNYAQCVPHDAEKTEEGDEVTYKYQLDGVSVVKTLNKDTCLPVSIAKSRRGGVITFDYEAVGHIENEGVFDDADVSHCEE